MRIESPSSIRDLVALFALALLMAAPAAAHHMGPELPHCDGDPADADLDCLPDALEDALMVRFAPELRFHPDEQYFPANPEWYISHASLHFEHEGDCEPTK